MVKLLKLFILFLMTLIIGAGAWAQGNDVKYRNGETEQEKEKDILYKSAQRFRLGEIIDAGISKKSVKVLSANKLLPQKIAHKIYAIIRVKLDPGRSISIHDFSLIHNYRDFPCIALRPYQGAFDAAKRIFPQSPKSRVFDLLFLLNIPDFSPTIKYKCTLHYNISGGGLTDVDVKFKNFDRKWIKLAAVPKTGKS